MPQQNLILGIEPQNRILQRTNLLLFSVKQLRAFSYPLVQSNHTLLQYLIILLEFCIY